MFLLTGFLSGAFTCAAGFFWPSILLAGAGAIFFAAVLIGLAATGLKEHLAMGKWRLPLGAALSTFGYIAAVFTFSVVGGFAAETVRVGQSRDITDFGGDVWLGLLAAAALGAVALELLSFLLTAELKLRFVGHFALAALVSLCAAFSCGRIVRSIEAWPTRKYWAFVGVLFSLGESLWCGVLYSRISGSCGSAVPPESVTAGARILK